MKILITAGGTSEKIDDVRFITNSSSGRLGAVMATTFLQAGHEVVYVTTKNAVKPAGITPLLISSTADLARTLTTLLETQHFDAVIHSMAVSDFTLASSFSKESFVAEFSAELKKNQDVATSFAALAQNQPATGKKISSNTDNLVLILEKTPKVIQLIKKIQPTTRLIGFKLLVDVAPEELIAVAAAARKKNDASLVIANDLTEVGSDNHHAYFVGATGVVAEAFTKKEIATTLVSLLSKEEL